MLDFAPPPRFESVGKRDGFTLLELLCVLALLGLGLAELLPEARRQMNRTAVVAAREEVAGLFQRARVEAVTHGGSRLVLRSDPPSVELRAGSGLVAEAALDRSYGVELLLSRDRSRAELVFGPLGLGRVASQTLRFRRGGAEVRLVVSSLGRVTRP